MGAARRLAGEERGQSSAEWIGLVLLVALLCAALVATGLRVPGVDLARALASRLLCAVSLGEECADPRGALVAAFGPELAGLVLEYAPELRYERGMRALPVDFRSCRADACAEGPERGEVTRSLAGEPVTAFVDVLDCRDPVRASPRLDCSGKRAGNLYLHYWLYYPGSATARALLGRAGYHPDDWESFQVRIGSGGATARASSHHGYNYLHGARNWPSDLGISRRPAWGPATRSYYIAGGSHAGHAFEFTDRRPVRWTPPDRIRLVPIPSLTRRERATRFAVTPPWRKRVSRDPEYAGTD